jgi:hypothetical protein
LTIGSIRSGKTETAVNLCYHYRASCNGVNGSEKVNDLLDLQATRCR